MRTALLVSAAMALICACSVKTIHESSPTACGPLGAICATANDCCDGACSASECTSSGVDSGGDQKPALVVDCEATSSGDMSAICSCTASGSGSVPMYAGEACESLNESVVCCAGPGYPSSGSCTCNNAPTPYVGVTQSNASVIGPGATTCTCGNILVGAYGGIQTNSCDLTPNAADKDGIVRRCCSEAKSGGKCYCEDITGATNPGCPSSDLPVDGCATPAVAHLPVATPFACPSAQTQASFCSTGPTPSPGSSGSSGSSDGGASSTTCVAGSKTIYECCALAGGACESLDAYAACCESATCGSAKLIACLAAYSASSVDACTAALKACGS